MPISPTLVADERGRTVCDPVAQQKRGGLVRDPEDRPSEGWRERTLRLRVFVGVEKESSGTVSANLNTPARGG